MDNNNLNQNFTDQTEQNTISEKNTDNIPTPEKTENEDKGFLVRPIRTYQDDVAKFVKNKKVSTAQIVLAEQNRRQNLNTLQSTKSAPNVKALNVAPKPESKDYSKILKPIIKTLVAVLLITGGLFVLYFLYNSGIIQKQITNITTPKIIDTQELIEKENKVLIDTTGKQISKIKSEILSTISNTEKTSDGEITEIQIVKTGASENKELINTVDFFNIFKTNASDKILRSLDSTFFFGLYNSSETHPFIIFKTNEFEEVFSEMFEWEFYLVNDFADIFSKTLKIEPVGLISTSTTDAISTTTTQATLIDNQLEFDPRDFKDLVLNNNDLRVIIDTKGNNRFMYGFVGDEFLVLTSDSETFKEISRRLRIQKLRR